MKKLVLLLSLVSPFLLKGQNWIDTTYEIETSFNQPYGMAIDFAGHTQGLEMDISYPTNDTAPQCGRPLLVMIHGGAWIVGDKNEGNAKRIREDFAKRGYTTASIDYRLGQFHTNQHVNCNIPDWNCFNMADTLEWYRANYRGIQDAHGAIRYLMNNASIYNIDPLNTFIVGESAGGFIAIGTGFMDSTEVLSTLIDSVNKVLSPNSLYESPCIQHPTYNLAPSIASMNLNRPALGAHEGELNNPTTSMYQIKAVGNFYGGSFNNIFHSSSKPPALYLYHQYNDLIVPYNYQKLLAGYVGCHISLAGCGYLTNRPKVYGSKGIKTLLDTMNANSLVTPDYYFDNTLNNSNCLQQATTPSLQCHAIDNYWLRTTNMATFFASKIDGCSATGILDSRNDALDINIYPNPTDHNLTIDLGENYSRVNLTIMSYTNQLVSVYNLTESRNVTLDLSELRNGIYFLKINLDNNTYLVKRIIVEKGE